MLLYKVTDKYSVHCMQNEILYSTLLICIVFILLSVKKVLKSEIVQFRKVHSPQPCSPCIDKKFVIWKIISNI